MKSTIARTTARVCVKHAAILSKYIRRLGDGVNANSVHDVRIICRRIALALRIAEQHCRVKGLKKTRRKVESMRKILSAARDAEVLEERARRCRSPRFHALIAGLHFDVAFERLSASRALSQSTYVSLPEEIVCIGRHLRRRDSGSKTGPMATLVLRKRVKKILDFSREGVTSLSADQWLHRLRIAIKKLRYAAEFFDSTIYGRVIAITKKFQRILGEFHDSCIVEQHLSNYVRIKTRRIERRARCSNLEICVRLLIRQERSRKKQLRFAFGRIWKKENLKLLSRAVEA